MSDSRAFFLRAFFELLFKTCVCLENSACYVYVRVCVCVLLQSSQICI